MLYNIDVVIDNYKFDIVIKTKFKKMKKHPLQTFIFRYRNC